MVALCVVSNALVLAQADAPASNTPAPTAPVKFSTQEDHRNMMKQLGITRLRPGPSGNPTADNFLKYATEESAFGSKNASDLPVDSHQLIALCAPRLTFISYGVPEKGDANWLDQRGSFMATVAAAKVFELLGAKGLGITADFRTASMPAVNQGLLDGSLAWRQHDGGHTDAPNMTHFIRWAEEHFTD